MIGKDPYFKITHNPYYHKTLVSGRVVAVLDMVTRGRDLVLMPTRSRVVRTGDIHELILTDGEEALPGGKASDAIYLAFVEITEGGVLLSGDVTSWNNSVIGNLAGFDETHAPNHYNVVIKAESPKTGREYGLALGDTITFTAE